jgi:hypothetical protein
VGKLKKWSQDKDYFGEEFKFLFKGSGIAHCQIATITKLRSVSSAQRRTFHLLRLTFHAYFVSSFTRWPSSGRMSFSIASLTAFSEPGVEKRIRPLMIPAVARLMMAGEPIS